MPKNTARFRVEPPLAQILLGGQEYLAGEHQVALSASEAKELAAHVAAGGVFLIEGKLPDVIEADAVTLEKQLVAQATGAWQEGNLLDFEAVQAAQATVAVESTDDEVED